MLREAVKSVKLGHIGGSAGLDWDDCTLFPRSLRTVLKSYKRKAEKKLN